MQGVLDTKAGICTEMYDEEVRRLVCMDLCKDRMPPLASHVPPLRVHRRLAPGVHHAHHTGPHLLMHRTYCR